MFHYSGWVGYNDNHDLRFLPDRFRETNDLSFDLRGLIQLESGPLSSDAPGTDYPSFNRLDAVTRHDLSYPEGVTGIKVNVKAQGLHFLMGAVFANSLEKGTVAATLKMHYEDGSSDTMSLIGKKEIFDWWDKNGVSGLEEGKTGWIGRNPFGTWVTLTKPYWKNPHPDKVITHFDFVSGMVAAAPFLIAVTAER